MSEPKAKTPPIKIVAYVASGLGLASWAAHMILKYAVGRPMPIFLWMALGLILLGFALRRSTAS